MDFTITIYRRLLDSLQTSGYAFETVEGFLRVPREKTVVLRHDVDKLPANALRMARLEQDAGIGASYYFRTVSVSWDETIIRKIAGLGHEIGYHYENLATCKGDMEQAFADFQANLARMRNIAPVSTICMHGSPLSRHDNQDLWKFYDYRESGIIGEPYFDVDYTKVFYITDTGRMWNNSSASIRDRVASGFDIPVKSTAHLMDLAVRGKLPDQVMITIHPQRWHDRPWPWARELVWQNTKNVVKRFVRFF